MGEIEKISGVTLAEYVQIVSTWHYYADKRQFNCAEQVTSMERTSNAAERIESFKQRNGCEHRISEVPRRTYKNLNFHSCYCNHLTSGFSALVNMTDYFQRGLLPYSGSVLEQPAKALEVIELITSLRAELEEKMQKQKAKQK